MRISFSASVSCLVFSLAIGLMETPSYALNLGGIKLRKLDGGWLDSAEMRKQKLIVFVASGSQCPVVRQYVSKLNSLSEKWRNREVQFYLINGAKHDSFQSFRSEFRVLGLHFPAALDQGQVLSARLGFQTTSQVIIYRGSTDEILYNGAIDDQNTVDGRKPVSTKEYLNSALQAATEGKPVPVALTQAFGCAITY